jgi:hypothetical protein
VRTDDLTQQTANPVPHHGIAELTPGDEAKLELLQRFHTQSTQNQKLSSLTAALRLNPREIAREFHPQVRGKAHEEERAEAV